MTAEMETIVIHNVINGGTAVSVTDGDKVFKKLQVQLAQEKVVELSFENIELLTTSFLNSAIGQLYKHFNSDFLNSHLKVSHLAKDDLRLLRKVIERAKSYFADQKSFENSVRESSEDYE